MKVKEKKVFGIGINDCPDPVNRCEKVNGKWRIVWTCPYYAVWKHMLERCYSEPYLKRKSTYRGCSVCPEWVYFMTFKAWMLEQDWGGKQLDKDILIEGNKLYSPETCRFVDAATNAFLTDSAAARGEWPLGVSYYKRDCRFLAQCCNPLTKKREHLGYFDCPEAAHKAWLQRKHQHALALADLQEDEAIAAALLKRYDPEIVLGKS